MGWHSAQRARQISVNVESILALEALGAAQGIDLLAPLEPARLTGEARAAIRELVPTLDHDRALYPEIEAIVSLIRSGRLAAIAAASTSRS
jgi:histidine ammonia-lyase